MDYNSNFEALGYHSIEEDPEAVKRVQDRQIDSSNSVILNEGEVIIPRAIVYQKTDFVGDDGKIVYKIRFHCQTNSDRHSYRLLRCNDFNPYPSNRAEFLNGSEFGESVLSYSGSAYDFMKSLIDRSFKVVKREKLKCKVYNSNHERVDGERYFHLFEEVK